MLGVFCSLGSPMGPGEWILDSFQSSELWAPVLNVVNNLMVLQ